MARACRLVSDDGELAAGVPGAGDQAGRGPRSPSSAKPRASISRLTVSIRSSRDVGDQQVLPDGQPDRPAAVAVGDVGQAAHLVARHPPDRQHDADVEQARLLLRMEADMAVLDDRAAGARTRSSGNRRNGLRQMLLGLLDVLCRCPQRSSTYFSRAFLPVGPVAVLDEDADDGGGGRDAFLGLSSTPVSRAKSLCPVIPPKRHPEIDARPGPPSPRATRTAEKPMSLVSSSALIVPPPSKAMLNLRGRPYISRWLRM